MGLDDEEAESAIGIPEQPTHTNRASDVELDGPLVAAMAKRGLRAGLVDTSDSAAFDGWIRADGRGFHQPEPSADNLARSRAGLAYRRTTGVWDDSHAVQPDPAVAWPQVAPGGAMPVGTVDSWVAQLSIPGERTVDAWAISGVSVAPTHRRRGIARALLEGELRTAVAAEVPLAILTVSESTIYGRFGFAPAAFAASLSIETQRTQWAGGETPGRVRFIELSEFRSLVESLHESNRASGTGEIEAWGLRWDELVGIASDDAERTRLLRAVGYVEPDGTVTGAALYQLIGGDSDFTKHTVTVERLTTTTADAASALWRFLLELDLVSLLTVQLRPIDDPVRWQVSDMRAVTLTSRDHLWTRILDVPVALEARRFSGSGSFVLEVSDELGFAAGRFSLEIVEGTATVVRTDAAATLALSVNELSALYLGGVAATTLADARRITELKPGAVATLDAAFRTARAPWLSIWF